MNETDQDLASWKGFDLGGERLTSPTQSGLIAKQYRKSYHVCYSYGLILPRVYNLLLAFILVTYAVFHLEYVTTVILTRYPGRDVFLHRRR